MKFLTLSPLLVSFEINTILFRFRILIRFLIFFIVSGHEGKLVIGKIAEQTVLCMVGRFHFYEGHHLRQVTFPVRVFAKLGVKNLIVTNAAGGLNTSFEVGNVMVIGDHFTLAGLAGLNPLLGPNLEDFGPRFPSTSDAYTMELRKLAFQAADKLEGKPLKLVEGTYTFVSGPSYETRAEGRLLRTLGADAVGMSTVPEVIVAKHCGMRILGLSLITNVVVTTASSVFEEEKKEIHATHQEVLDASIVKAQAMQGLVREIVSNF